MRNRCVRGVYIAKLPHGSTGYARWDGEEWKNNWMTKERAARDAQRGMQSKCWRGLAHNPNS